MVRTTVFSVLLYRSEIKGVLRDGTLCGFRWQEEQEEGKTLLNEKQYDLYTPPYINLRLQGFDDDV